MTDQEAEILVRSVFALRKPTLAEDRRGADGYDEMGEEAQIKLDRGVSKYGNLYYEFYKRPYDNTGQPVGDWRSKSGRDAARMYWVSPELQRIYMMTQNGIGRAIEAVRLRGVAGGLRGNATSLGIAIPVDLAIECGALVFDFFGRQVLPE